MKVNITETVLRDANQSLIATRMPFSDFDDVLETLDKAGYYSIECWGGATFDSCLGYLGEDGKGLNKLKPKLRIHLCNGQAPGEIDAALIRKVLGDEKPITTRFADTLEPEFYKVKEQINNIVKSKGWWVCLLSKA